jgi:hypothetical protein
VPRAVCSLGAFPTPSQHVDGILIQNLGAVTLYLGASTVTAGTTATGGLQVAANAIVNVPTTGASSEALYGIVASSTANVAFLYPG